MRFAGTSVLRRVLPVAFVTLLPSLAPVASADQWHSGA